MDSEDVRLAVYDAFANFGRPPSHAELGLRFGVAPNAVRRALRELAGQRHLVLDRDDAVLMAHPFSAIPLGFAVMGRETLWWGGCAWDAFALASLLPGEGPMLVSTRCPACARPHAWDVVPDRAPSGAQVAHFAVPAARMWDDVVRTCANQRIFCDPGCVQQWLDEQGEEHGYSMDLATLLRLARHWYDGLLERGYVRRDPSAAADYLRGVGLSGSFWGL